MNEKSIDLVPIECSRFVRVEDLIREVTDISLEQSYIEEKLKTILEV